MRHLGVFESDECGCGCMNDAFVRHYETIGLLGGG